MKKVIWNSLFISLLLFLSCNNSSEGDKTKDSRVKTYQEDVKDHTDNKKDLTPLEQGLNFAMQTQKVLAENLMNEINTQGTVHAFTFCSAKAVTLTDSMALALNIQIKRVSGQTNKSQHTSQNQKNSWQRVRK